MYLSPKVKQEVFSKHGFQKKFTFPVYTPDGDLTEQANVPTIPTTFIVGQDGEIKFVEMGLQDYSKSRFRKLINSLLK